MASKVYVVTRDDLPAGQQAVQSCHALAEFVLEFGPLARTWQQESNTLALLSVPDEITLEGLARSAERRCAVIRFREPDRNNELTAIALGPEGRRLVQNLPLTLR